MIPLVFMAACVYPPLSSSLTAPTRKPIILCESKEEMEPAACWHWCLLAEPRLSLAEISYRLGFPSQAHFTTIFRKFVGATPAASRREQ
jgi:Helix-turn-helix domain